MNPEIENIRYVAEHLTNNGSWVRLEDTLTFGEVINSIGVSGTLEADPLSKDPIERVIQLLKRKDRRSKEFRIVRLVTNKYVVKHLEKNW